jgi:hypothetical protein
VHPGLSAGSTASPAAVGSPAATVESVRVVEAVSTSDLSSCGSDVAQFSESSVHSGSDLDDEIDELGQLDENQKTVAHWLRNLGMLEYWPQFFEHELCDMVGACDLSRPPASCLHPSACLHSTAARLAVHRAGGGLARHGGGTARYRVQAWTHQEVHEAADGSADGGANQERGCCPRMGVLVAATPWC